MELESCQDKWWYNPCKQSNNLNATELAFGRVKIFLYESLYRCITKRDLSESFQLLKVLPKVLSIDPYVLFRFLMILIESNSTDDVHKNLIIHLEASIAKLYINKPDIFVEFLSYFIKNNRIYDAKELFTLRNRFMSGRIHQWLPSVDINIKCYEFLFNYLQWNEKYQSNLDSKIDNDVSFQGKLVNIIDCLKTVETNHEYFVMCLIKILLNSGYNRKAYLIASEFLRNNPNNISASLIHLHLLRRLKLLSKVGDEQSVPMDVDSQFEEQISKRSKDVEGIKNFTSNVATELMERNEYPFQLDRAIILENLRKLDPSRREIIKNLNLHDNLIDALRDIMNGFEVIKEFKNMNRWLKLNEVLIEIFDIEPSDLEIISGARFLWHSRYRRYWRNLDIDRLLDETISRDDKNTILNTIEMLYSKLDYPIET